jgi:thioredoxin-related protein
MITKIAIMVKVVIVLFISLFLSACDLNDSKNVILKQVHNHNRIKKAVLFLKQNGATLDNSIQVSIFPVDRELRNEDVGNVFTVDSNHDSACQSNRAVDILWLSTVTLRIEYDKKLRTFTKMNALDGITVVYEPK